MQWSLEMMGNKVYVLHDIYLLMMQKQMKEGMQTQRKKGKNKTISRARASRSNFQDKGELFSWTCAENKKTYIPWHTTHLPCVSVDWVNQPNFPFFFSVRSASVTPWCYQHAVHTARQQRQKWVSTQQRGREGERKRDARQEKAAIQTAVQTQLPCPEQLQKNDWLKND